MCVDEGVIMMAQAQAQASNRMRSDAHVTARL
jgi:hypothetical protein